MKKTILAEAVASICHVSLSSACGFEEACPQCGEVLLRERGGRLEAPHGPYYHDGDTIPGSPAEGAPDLLTCWYSLEVGWCPQCGADLAQINGEHALVAVDGGAWHRLDRNTPRQNFVVNAERAGGPPLRWLMTEFRVGDWRRYDHEIGPLLLNARAADGLRGPYGVAACGGGGRGVWERAARVSRHLHPWMRRCLELAQPQAAAPSSTPSHQAQRIQP